MIDESRHLGDLFGPRDVAVEGVEVAAGTELNDADAFFGVPVDEVFLLEVGMEFGLVDSRDLRDTR